MHKYIDLNKLRVYGGKKTMADIGDDIQYKYNITNILDMDVDAGEGRYYIIQALYDDYRLQRANYEAYIEKGMNARVLMELRKSAILLLADKYNDFYTGHSECTTVDDIRQYRANYLKFLNIDYADLNWQYYYLVKYNLRGKAKDFLFDYEDCFDDGDPQKLTTPDDYSRDFVDAHLLGYIDMKAVRAEEEREEQEYIEKCAEYYRNQRWNGV